jgi:magnesium transporter
MSDIQKLKKRLQKTGLPPGVLHEQEESRQTPIQISVIDYDQDSVREKTVDTIEECFIYKDSPSITWINIDGNQSAGIVEKVGECFNIHPLVLEDIMTSGQRPKFEDYGDYIVIILKMIYPGTTKNEIIDEQLSLLVGTNYVVSFQEKPGDPFNVIRERIRKGLGRIRKMGADYLAYILMDIIIDNYFIIIEKIGEEMEEIEEEIVENPNPITLKKTHDMKRALIFFREVVSMLNRSDSKLIDSAAQFYFRDIYDHVIQLIDTIETYRDLIASNIEIYLSNIGNKTNSTMKRLTMVATIFMPLTVVSGIGGMSEWSMITGPQNWMISYPLFIIGLGAISFLMYMVFKLKKWL